VKTLQRITLAPNQAAVVFSFDPDSQVMRRASCDPELVAAYAAELAERGLEVAVYFPGVAP
jgi:hypothetical protein